jgi:hypothetical protein
MIQKELNEYITRLLGDKFNQISTRLSGVSKTCQAIKDLALAASH